eukprot:156095-Rhodomonas_salina.3
MTQWAEAVQTLCAVRQSNCVHVLVGRLHVRLPSPTLTLPHHRADTDSETPWRRTLGKAEAEFMCMRVALQAAARGAEAMEGLDARESEERTDVESSVRGAGSERRWQPDLAPFTHRKSVGTRPSRLSAAITSVCACGWMGCGWMGGELWRGVESMRELMRVCVCVWRGRSIGGGGRAVQRAQRGHGTVPRKAVCRAGDAALALPAPDPRQQAPSSPPPQLPRPRTQRAQAPRLLSPLPRAPLHAAPVPASLAQRCGLRHGVPGARGRARVLLSIGSAQPRGEQDRREWHRRA